MQMIAFHHFDDICTYIHSNCTHFLYIFKFNHSIYTIFSITNHVFYTWEQVRASWGGGGRIRDWAKWRLTNWSSTLYFNNTRRDRIIIIFVLGPLVQQGRPCLRIDSEENEFPSLPPEVVRRYLFRYNSLFSRYTYFSDLYTGKSTAGALFLKWVSCWLH